MLTALPPLFAFLWRKAELTLQVYVLREMRETGRGSLYEHL